MSIRSDRKRARGKQRLEAEVQRWMRKGFVVRAKTETTVSLTFQKQHGLLWRATVGSAKVHDAYKGPKKGIVVNLLLTRSGKVKTIKRKQYV